MTDVPLADAPTAGGPRAGVPATGVPVVTPSPGDAEPTMPLRPVEPEPPTTLLPATQPSTTALPATEPPASALPATEPPTTVLPTPLAPPSAAPGASDLDLFEEPVREEPPAGAERPGSGRRTVALLVSGAVLAVLAVVAVTSGFLSYDTPSRNTALPTAVREAVPEARTTEPSRTPSPSTASAPPASASPSPTASASASPSPSPSRSSASPTPTPTPTPTQSATTARATSSPDAPAETAPVLRRGDRGPEVTELQLRLRQLYLYNDEPHGHFDDSVEQSLRTYQWSRGLQDELSVYGPKTRTLLESETREP